MILNDRKIKILEAIINDYIQTAEPIGSRTIAKKYDLGISSATIRNEMSDLEELGFIVQPHTSAGRVPSDKGYRLYVDQLMHFRELTNEETEFLQRTIRNNISHIDYLMQQTAKALALLTNYTTVVSEPKSEKMKVKHVQLIPLDEKSIASVVVTDKNVIKNHVIALDSPPNINELSNISNFINKMLKEHTIYEIKEKVFGDDEIQNFPYRETLEKAIDTAIKTVKVKEDIHIYTSGVNNILDFPEFSDVGKAKNIFSALEEKQLLSDVICANEGMNDNSIKIVIGNENYLEQLKDCSIIKTVYTFDDDSYGSIGIIGPTRMNYSQVVSILNGIVKNINIVIKAIKDGW